MLPTLLRRPAPSAASLLRAASSSPLAATKLGSAFNVLSAPSTQASTNTASLTLVLPAGSRAETSAGVASVFKNFAFKSNDSESALRVVRQTELVGGQLSATLTREHLLLTAEFLKGQEKLHLHTLLQNLKPALLAHEYNEAVVHTTSLESSAASATPAVAALEAAHRLAFRTGLGNSLFANPNEPVGLSDVHEFAQSLASERVGIVGTGLDQAELVATLKEVISENSTEPGASNAGKTGTKYFGGEARIPIDLHHVADGAKPTLVVAFGSTQAATPEQVVLPYLLAPPASVKWSAGSAPLSVADEGTTVEAFTQSYSDASLLVVEIQAEGSKRLSAAGKHVVSALQAFKADADSLKKAVAQAKTAVAAQWDDSETLRQVLAAAVLAEKPTSLEETLKSLDGVTVDGVNKALAAALKTKPTVAAVARLDELAYADELGLKI